MSVTRTVSLMSGTALIVGICYAVAAPARSSTTISSPPSSFDERHEQEASPALAHQCHTLAEQLRQRSEASWAIRVECPFILAGDVSNDQLATLSRDTVFPTAQALRIDYFDQDPTWPITILMLSSEESYRAALRQFGHTRQAEYSGLYHREERLIILNLSTGAGTLAHELTHALAHADFPNMPEWFDEGLASLHEESEFSDDGLHLVGRDNWRRRFLQEAEQRDCWKSLDSLFQHPFARQEVAALDYALARYLCLYLQERSLLSAFYRKCRSAIDRDATGQLALQRLFPGKSLQEIEQEFRVWLRERP